MDAKLVSKLPDTYMQEAPAALLQGGTLCPRNRASDQHRCSGDAQWGIIRGTRHYGPGGEQRKMISTHRPSNTEPNYLQVL